MVVKKDDSAIQYNIPRIELRVYMFTIPEGRQYHLLMHCRVSGG